MLKKSQLGRLTGFREIWCIIFRASRVGGYIDRARIYTGVKGPCLLQGVYHLRAYATPVRALPPSMRIPPVINLSVISLLYILSLRAHISHITYRRLYFSLCVFASSCKFASLYVFVVSCVFASSCVSASLQCSQ